MEMNESNKMGNLNFVQMVRDGLIDRAGMYSQVKGWSKSAIKRLLEDMTKEAFGILIFENTGANQPKKRRLEDMIDFLATEFCPSYDYYRKAPVKERQDSGQEKKGVTAADKKLATPELQAVKQKLIDVGLIVEGVWTGSAAQFKELVFNVNSQWGVENRGGYAWVPCARWVGYPTDKNAIKTAQNAGIVNPGDALGDIAETIRKICLRTTR